MAAPGRIREPGDIGVTHREMDREGRQWAPDTQGDGEGGASVNTRALRKE